MKITQNSLEEIVRNIKAEINNNFIDNVVVVNSKDILISFSMNRNKKLMISLNHQSPFVSTISLNEGIGTILGNTSETLRKEMKQGHLHGIEVVNNDRIVRLSYSRTNDLYEKENRFIFIELIPHRSNLILTKDDNTIIFATHYSQLYVAHPVVKGMKYETPTKDQSHIEEQNDFNYSEYLSFVSKYFLEAKHRRLEEQCKPILMHIKSRIKTLKGKLKILDNEIKEATNNLQYREIGDMLLAYSNDEEALNEYLITSNIKYDKSLSIGVNADRYFKKYKKAKRTIQIGKEELIKTNDEIHYLETCFSQTKYMNYEDIVELGELLFPKKFKQNLKKKVVSKISFVSFEGSKIFFGKNAKQNDELTFKTAHKYHYFFHVKDAHGSHVIIANENPSNEQILLACEISLLLSGLECGDVQFTQVKNVKKGAYLGQALLSSYQLISLKSIRESTKVLLSSL